MRNIKLILEYDGTNYAGWQSQTNATAIQDVISQAIEKMTEEKISLRGASRTDAGVHALGQVATFQTARDIPLTGFLKGLNTLLPDEIRVLSCEEVPLSFHPIDDAKSKEYQYVLEVSEIPSALWRNCAWWVGPSINIQAMEEASSCLVGEHDFRSFRGTLSSVKTTVRRIENISCQKVAATYWPGRPESSRYLLVAHFVGNGFLKYMIRNIVGTLVEIGLGRRPIQDMEAILLARDRTKAGPTAPAHGLYLVKIDYERQDEKQNDQV